MNNVAAIYAGPQPELSDGTVTLTALHGSDAPALVISDNDAQTARWFGWRAPRGNEVASAAEPNPMLDMPYVILAANTSV